MIFSKRFKIPKRTPLKSEAVVRAKSRRVPKSSPKFSKNQDKYNEKQDIVLQNMIDLGKKYTLANVNKIYENNNFVYELTHLFNLKLKSYKRETFHISMDLFFRLLPELKISIPDKRFILSICYFIATKYEEVKPLRISSLINTLLLDKKITADERSRVSKVIKKTEFEILNRLDYHVSRATVWWFVSYLLKDKVDDFYLSVISFITESLYIKPSLFKYGRKQLATSSIELMDVFTQKKTLERSNTCTMEVLECVKYNIKVKDCDVYKRYKSQFDYVNDILKELNL